VRLERTSSNFLWRHDGFKEFGHALSSTTVAEAAPWAALFSLSAFNSIFFALNILVMDAKHTAGVAPFGLARVFLAPMTVDNVFEQLRSDGLTTFLGVP